MLTVTILLIGQPPLILLARAAGLGKYVYGNGFTVMERISGTVLILFLKFEKNQKNLINILNQATKASSR